MNPKKRAAFFCWAWMVASLFLTGPAQAEEIKVVITGQAFATLYPCLCPKEPDGGVARRATAIRAIRAKSKNVLVVESGQSFASGSQDQYAQNMELDRRRTEIYLQALDRMGYDALLVSSQELAFGEEFLKKTKLPFVSSNVDGLGLPFVIKEVAGHKIGILGVTDALVRARGVSGWRFPAQALSQRIQELKDKGVSFVIVLSAMAPEESKSFLREVKGIDLLVDGGISFGSAAQRQEDGVPCVTTWWQSKKIGVLTLEAVDGKISVREMGSVALDRSVADDPEVAALLPVCFNDGECQRSGGLLATCQNPGGKEARCLVPPKTVVTVTVIRPSECRVCDVQKTIETTLRELGKMFGDVKVTSIAEDDPWAKDFLTRQWKTSYLPVYLFEKGVAETPAFAKLGAIFEKKDDYYILRQESAGVSYLYGRQRIPRRVDVIWDQRYKPSAALFGLLKDFRKRHPDYDVKLHFLWRATNDDGSFIPSGSAFELEELKRVACVDAISPERLLDYLVCRNEQAGSSWLDDCFEKTGLDMKQIKACALGAEGQKQMQAHLALSASLGINAGPTFIVENKEIFSIQDVPTIEELEMIVIPQDKKEK
jgi:hypothetical protein